MRVKRASDIPKPDTSYFIPWRLKMVYEIEPGLKQIADKASISRNGEFYERLDTYTEIKHEVKNLVGWFARDPRLRSSGAWDCFFHYVLEELKL